MGYISNSHLSTEYERIKNRSINGFATILDEARRGIFIYDEPSNLRSEFYHLCGIPEIYLKFEALPEEIKNYLNYFKIDLIKFSEIEKFNVTDFFVCDLDYECK